MFVFIFLVWLKAKREDEAAIPPAGGMAAARRQFQNSCPVSQSRTCISLCLPAAVVNYFPPRPSPVRRGNGEHLIRPAATFSPSDAEKEFTFGTITQGGAYVVRLPWAIIFCAFSAFELVAIRGIRVKTLRLCAFASLRLCVFALKNQPVMRTFSRPIAPDQRW